MARRISVVLGLAAALLLIYFAILAHAARAATPVDVLRASDSYDLGRDGAVTRIWRVEIRVANAAAARREAQQTMTYSPGLETLDLVEAATRKADGRVLPAGPDAVVEQLPRGSPELDRFTDRRQKVVLLPDVQAGDTVVVAWRKLRARPLLPGFATALYRPVDLPWRDLSLVVRVPRGTVLQSEVHGFRHSVTEDGEAVVHRWQADPAAVAEDSALAAFDRLPRVFVSTWRDWDALARDWAAAALPKAQPTPQIRALAERLVAGAADRREEARRIYDWVSARIRYVALYVGDGALLPTDAGIVLARGWGDCKDHVALFHALLAARSIAAEMVMVNLGDGYSLAGPPGFAQFDHLVTWLPEFGLYADTTAGTAPFGVLPFAAAGKPVLHAVASGALRRTPALAPGGASATLVTQATLLADGRIRGTTRTSATGPFAGDLRHSAQWAEGIGDGAAAAQLRALGLDGGGSFSFAPPETPGNEYEVNGRFALIADPALLEGAGFVPTPGLRLLVRPGDMLLGPLRRDIGETTAAPCHAGRQSEQIVLDLPPGRQLQRVPADLRLETDSVSYLAQWRLANGRLTITRELLSRFPGPVCGGTARREAAAALLAIRRELATQVALADDTAPGAGAPVQRNLTVAVDQDRPGGTGRGAGPQRERGPIAPTEPDGGG
ncbi:DUF3857 domain-containing transglutaminase family protein [Rhodovastum atsumiense]|uniref:DUF3857 domain-containing protein n=1 Tax=Rhodovastum atsumiense TaxID=504468 RepID=A0A5M6IXH4_9PROT|nr:DUF3857 and transglutaminase domain-containing protein [Rhodovastum atsumiense]KAA5612098.1 DUF3857 domain-containing protein [Rhodovastum atsumiense]